MAAPNPVPNGMALPLAAERLVPHRPPMRLVSRLVSVRPLGGVVEVDPDPAGLLADADGSLDPVALFEMIAQAYAAVKGYLDLSQGEAVRDGYLVGCHTFRVHAPAPAGQPLCVDVSTVATVGDFSVVEGQVSCAGQRLASGVIKVWVPPDPRA